MHTGERVDACIAQAPELPGGPAPRAGRIATAAEWMAAGKWKYANR